MSAGCKIFYIFRCTVGNKGTEQPNQIVTETPIWEILRTDIEQKVLRRAALGNNGRSGQQHQQQQQRGREACGQKLIGKVIANLSSADEALTRVGSSQDCHERATHLPWLSNNTLLENGDIVLLYRVPIDYEHHAQTESLLCDANHMRWLFLNKAQGNRLPAKGYKNTTSSATNTSAIPTSLLPLVRQTVSNSFSSKRAIPGEAVAGASVTECGHSKLFISSSVSVGETKSTEAEKLAGATESQRLEALLRKNTAALESDEPQSKRSKLMSDEPEGTFDSESFWTGTSNGRSSVPPPLYVCNRCGVSGHWLRDCPTKNDARFNGVKILTTNGIPKHYLKRVNVQDFDFDTTVTLYRDQEGHFFVKK